MTTLEHSAGRRRPLAAVALVFAADAVLARKQVPPLLAAVLDEPAHLATAGMLLAASEPWLSRSGAPVRVAVLTGSVAIDLDHLPELLGWLPERDGRPGTHSLVTAGSIMVAATFLPARWRQPMLGLAAGITLHLVRDLATGGAPLVMPLSRRIVRLPYPVYALLLLAAASSLRRQPPVGGDQQGGDELLPVEELPDLLPQLRLRPAKLE